MVARPLAPLVLKQVPGILLILVSSAWYYNYRSRRADITAISNQSTDNLLFFCYEHAQAIRTRAGSCQTPQKYVGHESRMHDTYSYY